MRILLPALLALASALPTLGCGDESVQCTAIFAYGLNITVTGQGQPVCTATVTAQDGAHQETLTRLGFPQGPCTYAGAGERAGTYAVTVVADGFTSQTVSGIVVTSDECHVIGVQRTVALVP